MQQDTSPSSVGQDTPGEDQQLSHDGNADSRNGGGLDASLADSMSNRVVGGGGGGGGGDLPPLESSPTAADGPSTGSAQRKRKLAGGGHHTGRSVANLTAEQLAKKRANDREAQRNIRERTKAQIESLERQIEQLKAQQPYQELQCVIREKEAAEAEVADLRRVLSSVLSIIQPHVAATVTKFSAVGGGKDPRANASNAHQPGPTSVPRAGFHHEHFMAHLDPGATPLSASGSAPSPAATSASYSMPWQAQAAESPASQAHAQQPLSFAPRPRSPNGQPTLLGMASSIYRMTDNEQEALNMLRLGEPGMEDRTATNVQHQHQQHLAGFASLPGSGVATPVSPAVVDGNLPVWARKPMNTTATCTLDTICLTFLHEIEKRLEQGTPVQLAVGGQDPDLNFILNPDADEPAGQDTAVGPLSRFFGQVLSNRMFPDLQKPPEKVGTAWLLYVSCYWQLSRTRDAYDKIPEWYRAGRVQHTVPHGPWADAMFWPKMRDAVILSQDEYRFDDLFVPLTRTISCNWPYPDSDILDTSSGQLRLSTAFLRHITKLENWTLGTESLQAYPKLKGTFNLRFGG